METKQKNLADLISKFENGQERYQKSALFAQVIDSLFHGVDPFYIINDLITSKEDQQKAFEDYIKTDVRPMGVMFTGQAAELYASEENRKKDEPKQSSPWKSNAEEDYLKVPISVLRYITELESELRSRVNAVDPVKIIEEHLSVYSEDNGPVALGIKAELTHLIKLLKTK